MLTAAFTSKKPSDPDHAEAGKALTDHSPVAYSITHRQPSLLPDSTTGLQGSCEFKEATGSCAGRVPVADSARFSPPRNVDKDGRLPSSSWNNSRIDPQSRPSSPTPPGKFSTREITHPGSSDTSDRANFHDALKGEIQSIVRTPLQSLSALVGDPTHRLDRLFEELWGNQASTLEGLVRKTAGSFEKSRHVYLYMNDRKDEVNRILASLSPRIDFEGNEEFKFYEKLLQQAELQVTQKYYESKAKTTINTESDIHTPLIRSVESAPNTVVSYPTPASSPSPSRWAVPYAKRQGSGDTGELPHSARITDKPGSFYKSLEQIARAGINEPIHTYFAKLKPDLLQTIYKLVCVDNGKLQPPAAQERSKRSSFASGRGVQKATAQFKKGRLPSASRQNSGTKSRPSPPPRAVGSSPPQYVSVFAKRNWEGIKKKIEEAEKLVSAIAASVTAPSARREFEDCMPERYLTPATKLTRDAVNVTKVAEPSYADSRFTNRLDPQMMEIPSIGSALMDLTMNQSANATLNFPSVTSLLETLNPTDSVAPFPLLQDIPLPDPLPQPVLGMNTNMNSGIMSDSLLWDPSGGIWNPIFAMDAFDSFNDSLPSAEICHETVLGNMSYVSACSSTGNLSLSDETCHSLDWILNAMND